MGSEEKFIEMTEHKNWKGLNPLTYADGLRVIQKIDTHMWVVLRSQSAYIRGWAQSLPEQCKGM